MSCTRCAGKGAVRLQYRSGEPFDVAICWCAAGQRYREMAPSGVLATCFAGADRIVWLEDAAEPEDFQRWGCARPSAVPDVVVDDALRSFGRMHKAGLGGQKVAP